MAQRRAKSAFATRLDRSNAISNSKEQGENPVIPVLNLGRILMGLWIVYGLILIFAPALVHRPPSQLSGAIQVAIAFALGHLMERAISALHRRRRAAQGGNALSD
jgi:hypothetical protein